MRNPYRVGEGIYLRPLDAMSDAVSFTEWFNDPEVTRNLRRYRPITANEQVEFLRASEGKDSQVVLAIVRRKDDRLIGATGLHDIDARNRNCWFGICIGDKSAWGQGHGTEATRMMLKIAFDTLNLERVELQVYEFNARAIHVYEKLGFRVEGRLRSVYFCEGRYHDNVVMGILREEWAVK
jgi:RimJ/RimL family protein N-acetyltransferase